MNLTARAQVLLAPEIVLWSGTVVSYDEDTFVLTVSTGTGDLAGVEAGLALGSVYAPVRIRDVDAGSNTLTLAENGNVYEADDAIWVWNVRVPFPRYQRIAGGIVYKDFDITFTSLGATDEIRGQRALPPSIFVSPAVVYCHVDEDVDFSAAASRMVAYATSPDDTIDFVWDAGDDGTETPSGDHDEYCTCSWSSAGFRYLVVTGTDYYGTAATRYIPVFVDAGTDVHAGSCALRYNVNGGWRADVALSAGTVPDLYAGWPVIVIDPDEADPEDRVIFHGYIEEAAIQYDFELRAFTFGVSDALAYMRRLHAYPFIVQNTDGDPSSWVYIYKLSMERAAYFLLWWHSNLPELCNIALGTIPGTGRAIKGQEFSAGSLADQLKGLLQAAYYDLWAYRGGGFAGDVSVLFRTQANFEGIATALGDDEIEGDVSRDEAQIVTSELRAGGVYRNQSGNYTPVIVRAPAHPEALGRPSEIQGLAPISASEIADWAARAVALDNSAARYSGIKALADVDPATQKVIAFADENGDTVYVAVESAEMRHTDLEWRFTLAGRIYGATGDAVNVPLPPPVVVPGPSVPEIPETDPIAPIDGYVVRLGLSSGSAVVYLCRDYTAEPQEWVDVTGDLSLSGVPRSVCLMRNESAAACIVTSSTGEVYLCADVDADSPAWAAVSAPSGYEFKQGPMAPNAVQSSERDSVLLNVYAGATAAAWVIGPDGSEISLTDVGNQTTSASRHVSFYDGDGEFFAGHDDGEIPEHLLAKETFITPNTDIPSDGTYTDSENSTILRNVMVYSPSEISPNEWHYATYFSHVDLLAYNPWWFDVDCELKWTVTGSNGEAYWKSPNGPWVPLTSTPIVIKEIDYQVAPGLTRYESDFIAGDMKILTRLNTQVTVSQSAYCASAGLTLLSNVIVTWGRVADLDGVHLWHIQVPSGYSGSLDDLKYGACGGGYDDSCCASSGAPLACPAWADRLIRRVPGKAWAAIDDDDAMVASLDSMGSPCADPGVTGPADPLFIPDAALLDNGVGEGGAVAVVNSARDAVYVSSNAWQTYTEIDPGLGRLERGVTIVGRIAFVAGEDGIAAIDLDTLDVTDITGDLPGLDPEGAVLPVSVL